MTPVETEQRGQPIEAREKDRCSGVLITAAGLIGIALSLGLPIGSLARPAAGTFPLILSVVLTLLGAILTAQQIKLGLNWSIVRETTSLYGRDLTIFLVLIGAYLIAFEPIGFLVATTIFLTAMLWHFQDVPLWRSLLSSLVLSTIAYLLFNQVFQMRLPMGLLALW